MFRLVTMLWLMLFFSFSALADYDEGVSAYEKANYGLALKAFEQSAKAGHTDAQTYLGVMYELGQGVKMDYEKALMWYRKAAAEKNPTAEYNLGQMYFYGRGVKEDQKQAVVW